MWPAEDRLLSPLTGGFLAAIAAAAAVAVAEHAPLRIVGAVVLVSNIGVWGDRWLDPITRLEERYATSKLVASRLELRSRWRAACRAALPKLKLARFGFVSVCVLILVVAIALAGAGFAPSGPRVPAAIGAVRVISHLASYGGLATTVSLIFLWRATRWWDEQEESPLCLLPVVTTAEVLRKLSRPTPLAILRLVGLIGGLVLLYV
jgi:hypothetical protein